jgi:iron complex outermembrane receptor protein
VSDIVNQSVPAYEELDLRLGWRPVSAVELSVSGQNLLHEYHVEFGTGAARRAIKRGVFARVTWQF